MVKLFSFWPPIVLGLLILSGSVLVAAEPIKVIVLDPGQNTGRQELRLGAQSGLRVLIRTTRNRYMDVELQDPTVTFEQGRQKQRINDPLIVTLDKLIFAGDPSDSVSPIRIARSLEEFEVRDSIGQRGFSMPGAVDEPTEPAIRAILDQLKGKAIGSTIDRFGRILQEDHHFTYMDYIAQGMAGEPFFAAFQPVFPEEPIGAGARWTVERDLILEGTLTLPIKVTFSLDSMDADSRTISYEVSDAGPVRDFQFPIPVENGTASVGKSDLSAHGRIRLESKIPVPVEMDMISDFSFGIVIEREGLKATYTMDINLNYKSAIEKIEMLDTL